jgi:predicted GNAT family N-acyltransferase
MPNSGYIQAHDMQFEVLNSNHNLSAFDCSEDDELGLNEFIHEEALDFQRENLGITYLFFHNGVIVGFATLAMSQIEIKGTKVKLPFQTEIRDFPALMIGRLATDNNFRARHVGRNISLRCVSKAQQLSHDVGCRLIVIRTNDKKYAFYKNCGFEIVPKDEKKPKKWMYLPIP